MTLPTFAVMGVETMDGFKAVVLKSCENFQVSFEIFGSSSFIRRAQAQLLLGSTTATIDKRLVRLHGVQATTDSDPKTAMIFSRYDHMQ